MVAAGRSRRIASGDEQLTGVATSRRSLAFQRGGSRSGSAYRRYRYVPDRSRRPGGHPAWRDGGETRQLHQGRHGGLARPAGKRCKRRAAISAGKVRALTLEADAAAARTRTAAIALADARPVRRGPGAADAALPTCPQPISTAAFWMSSRAARRRRALAIYTSRRSSRRASPGPPRPAGDRRARDAKPRTARYQRGGGRSGPRCPG